MSVAVPQPVPKTSRRSPRTRLVSKRMCANGTFAGAWLLFAIAHIERWHATGRPVGLGTAIVELIVAALFFARREPWVTSRSPLAWTASAIGAFGVLGARPAYAPLFGLGSLYLVLQLIGAALACVSLGFLGRSFGVVAANRGIRTRGAYRIVRHPIYAAYCITFTGYTLENPSPRNVVLFLAVTAFQLVRIRTEEDCLRADPDYLRYSKHVRYRLVPYVW